MANTKVYLVTKKYQALCEELENDAMATLTKRFPDLDVDEISLICPPIATWEVGDPYADLGDYDDEDVPKLDKMVELGLLEIAGEPS